MKGLDKAMQMQLTLFNKLSSDCRVIKSHQTVQKNDKMLRHWKTYKPQLHSTNFLRSYRVACNVSLSVLPLDSQPAAVDIYQIAMRYSSVNRQARGPHSNTLFLSKWQM